MLKFDLWSSLAYDAANFHLPTEEGRPNSSNFFGFSIADTRVETFAHPKKNASAVQEVDKRKLV